MNHLRKALNETTHSPQFIQNYPRKGYVWICPAVMASESNSKNRLLQWWLPFARHQGTDRAILKSSF